MRLVLVRLILSGTSRLKLVLDEGSALSVLRISFRELGKCVLPSLNGCGC